MIQGIPKISVLIITYKQEELIKRAINSILAQIDYVYEICVSDDCSPDRTWEVLKEYERQYPGLFKLNRNNPNLGIFQNIEYTWKMPTGDLIYRLAGDDECGDGWFKSVIEFIQEHHLDYKNDRFAVYGDYEARYPSGDSFVFSNDAVESGIDPVRLSMRGIIGNRSAVCTRKVVESYKVVSKGKSQVAESAIDRQLPLFSKNVYYIPQVGNIYYARIGISAHDTTSVLHDREEVEPYAMMMLKENGYKFTKTDESHILLKAELAKSYRDKSIKHLLKIVRLMIASFDPSISFKAFRFKRYLFALRIRLPHRRPIKITV